MFFKKEVVREQSAVFTEFFTLVGIFFFTSPEPSGIPDATGWTVLLINYIAMKVTGWELACLT